MLVRWRAQTRRATKARLVTARARMARVLERASRKASSARVTSTARVTGKARAKERRAKAKDRARRRDLHPTRVSQVLARLRSGNGGSSEFFLEFNSAERSGHHVGGCEDGSCHSRGWRGWVGMDLWCGRQIRGSSDDRQRKSLGRVGSGQWIGVNGLSVRMLCGHTRKFEVADVAYPVVSLGRMIETGFTFSFDDYKCYMHKDNRCVEIFRKGRIFVLRMRRKWLKGDMMAPIDGSSRCGEIEMDAHDIIYKTSKS